MRHSHSSSSTSWRIRSRACARWPRDRPGGVVAACVWDHAAGGQGPAERLLPRLCVSSIPQAPAESETAGSDEGQLGELFEQAGLVGGRGHLHRGRRRASRASRTGGRPTPSASALLRAGRTLDPARLEQLRQLCRSLLPLRPSFSSPAPGRSPPGRADARPVAQPEHEPERLPVFVDRAALVVDEAGGKPGRLHRIEVEVGSASTPSSARRSRARRPDRGSPSAGRRAASSLRLVVKRTRTSAPGFAPSLRPRGVSE